MMMSPLNILSSSALSNSSSGTNDSANRSPDCSKSPPSPALPPSNTTMPGKDPSVTNPAASLLHAFAGNPAAMSSTLAQFLPQFQLPLLAAFYSQHPMAQNPYGPGHLYGGVPQPQLSASILAAAKQMNPSAFLAMQSGKLSCKSELDSFGSPSKLSPGQQQASVAQTSPNPMFRGGSGGGAQSNPPPHPLMPLSMMAAKGGGLASPHTESSTSSRCSHPNSNTSSNSILSPVLFSPLSASEAQFKHRKIMSGPNEASEVPTSSAESAFTGNFHRISRSPGSGANNTPNTGGVFQCPICNISLEGVDIDEHYFEEMRKMDAMRKMTEWDSEEEKRRAEQLGKDPLAFLEHTNSKLPPPPPMAASASSYQKKLQLPQSRWETFQRIRQNRNARLAAFMRLTRRKWDAYESTLHSPSGNAAGTVATPHHSPSTGAQAPHQRSPNAPVASQPPPHHLASHAFEAGNVAVPCGAKASPNGPETSHQHSPHQTRASPMSATGHSGPYPPMPFGQNGSFFNFPYPYHPHLNPFNPLVPPPPPSYNFADSMYAAAAAAATTSAGPSNTTSTVSGGKIWRSVDTDQLESDERKEKEDSGRDAIDVVGESSQERDRVSRCSSISGGSVRSVESHGDKIGDPEKEMEGKQTPETHKSMRSEESGQSDGEEVDCRAVEDKDGDAEDEDDDVDVVNSTAEDPKRAYLKRHYADVFDELQSRKMHHGAFSSRATPSTSSEASSPFSYYISRSDSTETAPVS